jgi:ABC-type nitrate/sulfonate/bicarbonate transport system substrate-binding protein
MGNTTSHKTSRRIIDGDGKYSKNSKLSLTICPSPISSACFSHASTLKKHGLDPTKDVIILALGNIPERVQALLSGAVDAVDLNHPG